MNDEEIKVFFMALEEKGIKEIKIDYDGSGDSGSIEDAIFYNDKDEIVELPDFETHAKDIGDHIISRHYSWDWYNNEGGYGCIVIDIEDKTWKIDGYVREITSIEADADGDLDTIINSFS
jgi:hypothetical protein